MAEPGPIERDPDGSVADRVAHALDRHAAAVIGITVALTVLLTLPFLLMPPTSTASQEPRGEVFEARDLLAERLPWPVHHMVFVIEALDGNMLDRSSLLALVQHEAQLRADPVLGAKLAQWSTEVPQAEIDGILTIADVADSVLSLQGRGGLAGATEAQVTEVVNLLLTNPGPAAFQLSSLTRKDEDTDRWIAPAMLGHVLADNALLGGGSVDAVLGSDDTTKEQFARAVLDTLRGDQEHNAIWGLAIDVNLTSTEQGESAGPYIALTLLAVLLLLGLTFRSYWAVAVTGFGLGILMVWLHGLSNLVGLKNDQILSIIVPIAMISFGVDFAFHAIGRYREELARGGRTPHAAFVIGLGSVMTALLVAMVSDAVAFLSNATAGIESLVQFAIAASVATVSAFFILGVFTPLVLSRLEQRFGLRPQTRGGAALALAGGLISSLWAMGTVVVSVFVLPWGGAALLLGQGLVCLVLPAIVLGRLSAPRASQEPAKAIEHAGGSSPFIGAVVVEATRLRAVTLPVLALVTAVAAWGGAQSRASFDVRDFFSASTDFVVGLDKYDVHGVEQAGEPADIYIEADLLNPQVLGVVRRARDEIAALDTDRLARDERGRIKVGGGVVDLLEAVLASPRAQAAFVAAGSPPITDADQDGVPDTAAQLAAVLRIAPQLGVPAAEEAGKGLSPAQAQSMVSLGAAAGDEPSATRLRIEIRSSRVEEEVEATREYLAPTVASLATSLALHDPDARAVLTGGAIVRQASLDGVVVAFQRSFPFAVLFCLLAASFFMRSVRYGVVSTIPVILVAIWLYGFMFAVGYSLNVVTATIGAISIGVGIDFSVHFTMRFREELERTTSRLEALRTAGAGTGQALAASAFSSALGFTILAFAPMPMFASYGLLTAVMIVLALAASLLVLPTLLLLVTPERVPD